MTLCITELSLNESNQLVSLNANSFSDVWGERWSARDISSAMGMQGVSALAASVVEEDGLSRLVGFILARVVVDEAEILLIGVEPDCRRQGIAAALLDDFLRQSQQKGIARVFLEVRESNDAARALYKRAGFSPVGKRRNYYRNKNGETASAYTLEKQFLNL